MATGILKVKGDTIVDGNGDRVILKGAGLGGWMKYTSRVNRLHGPSLTLSLCLVWKISLPAFQVMKKGIEPQC